MHSLEVLSGERTHRTPSCGGAGERNHTHVRVGHQSLADVCATGQHAQYAGWYAGFLEDSRQRDASAYGSPGVGLQDDGIAES